MSERSYEIASAVRVVCLSGGRREFVSNVVGENLVPGIPTVEQAKLGAEPIQVGDEGVHALYGDADTGVTVSVEADDLDDAERRLIATFGDDGTIDDLQESIQTLDAADLVDAAEALDLFAGVDEGENVDADRLRYLARQIRSAAGRVPGRGILAVPALECECGIGLCPSDEIRAHHGTNLHSQFCPVGRWEREANEPYGGP